MMLLRFYRFYRACGCGPVLAFKSAMRKVRS